MGFASGDVTGALVAPLSLFIVIDERFHGVAMAASFNVPS